MATLIKTDGSKLEIQPQNGLDFQLDELQKFVDGYIDIINLHNGDILVINDNGKDFYPVNHRATEIAHTNNAIFLLTILLAMWCFVKIRRCNNERHRTI